MAPDLEVAFWSLYAAAQQAARKGYSLDAADCADLVAEVDAADPDHS